MQWEVTPLYLQRSQGKSGIIKESNLWRVMIEETWYLKKRKLKGKIVPTAAQKTYIIAV